MNLIHIQIHCNIVNYKANLKHFVFHSLKGINALVNGYIMLNSSINCYCIKTQKKMPSYLTVTSNGLFLIKSFEERGVHKLVFQDYFKTNQNLIMQKCSKENIEGV